MSQSNLIFIIGLSGQGINDEKKALLNTCCALFCAEKYSSTLCDVLGGGILSDAIFPITPMVDLFDNIQKKLQSGNVAVIASGDPLFFGIGKKLCLHFGADRVRIYPDLSYMQIAFSRFKINWDDAEIVSLHGRKGNLSALDLQKDKWCFFTDDINTPQLIARHFQNMGDASSYKMHVAENLSFENEYLFSGSLDEILVHRTFLSPNIVILVRQELASEKHNPVIFGLKESDIDHSRGLITKNEIRAVSIHQLSLPAIGVFWDVGGGSGSISIEVAGIAPHLQVYCVEKKVEEEENIHINRNRFQRNNMIIIQGEAPVSLANLPTPDRIFIGGSGGRLKEIVEYCCSRLNKGGKIVINCVLKENADLAPKLLFDNGLRVEISEVSVRRIGYPDQEATVYNPITIITGSLSQ